MGKKTSYDLFLGRIFDLSVPILSWILITLPLWLSPFHPALVAYFIIAFDLYFLYSCLETVYYSSLSYNLLQTFEKISFHSLVKNEVHKLFLDHWMYNCYTVSHIHALFHSSVCQRNLIRAGCKVCWLSPVAILAGEVASHKSSKRSCVLSSRCAH